MFKTRAFTRAAESLRALGTARAHAGRWLDGLSDRPGVERAEPPGSLRRWRDTIGEVTQ